jgi:hypothetical protein
MLSDWRLGSVVVEVEVEVLEVEVVDLVAGRNLRV